MMKIVIIGAGIAGLTLGLACQRAGMDVKIFDKANELRTIGGGLLLWPHGLRFLDELDLSACLRSAWMSVRRINIISHRGEKIYGDANADLYQLMNGEILPIDRSHLQQLLVSQLNDNTLVLGKTCIGIVNHADTAQADFADGTTESADLIIGADGVRSAVRAVLFPEATLSYTGFCWWGGMVDHQVVPHFPFDEVQYVLGQGKICSIWPTHGKRFMWYLPVKLPLESFAYEDAGHQLAQQICQGWNEDVSRIVAAPQQAQRFHVPIEELPPLQHYSVGHTVLIGDAALAFGPLLGQGANKAIEDAYLLAKLLTKTNGSLPEKLCRYETLRRVRHQRFFDLERLSTEALIHDTPEALQFFEEQLPKINLVTMYQDMIPLVNAAACQDLDEQSLVLA